MKWNEKGLDTSKERWKILVLQITLWTQFILKGCFYQSLIVGFKKQKYTTDCISCHLICLIMKLFGKKIATYNAKHVSKETLILFFRKLSY